MSDRCNADEQFAAGQSFDASQGGKRRKRPLSMDECIALSGEVGRRIAALDPPADIVIGLANGGTLPAIVAAEEAGLECEIIKIRRKGSRIKQRLRFLRSIFSAFPGLSTLPPVAKAKRVFDKRFNQVEARDQAEKDFDPMGRNIVIVDDCVDSGSSIALVRSRLRARGAASVRVAVIAWGTKFDSAALHGVTPDIHLTRTIDIYPWALDSPEYGNFKRWLAARGQQLWV